MITTNTETSRAVADDGKRRLITTSNMKPRPLPLFPRDFPGVRKVEQKKPDKTFIQTSELEDMKRKAKKAAPTYFNPTVMKDIASKVYQEKIPAAPKRAYERKATGRKKKA